MADETYSYDVRPMLEDLAARLARIEQHLARTSGYESGGQPMGTGPGAPGQQDDFSFGSAPASFGTAPAPNGPMAQPFGPGSPLPSDVVDLARNGKAIKAIQLYRELTGVSLKEAKQAVDEAIRGY
jgi:hypothetical protein